MAPVGVAEIHPARPRHVRIPRGRHRRLDPVAALRRHEAVIGPEHRGPGVQRGRTLMACLDNKFRAAFGRDLEIALGFLDTFVPPAHMEHYIDEMLSLMSVNADEAGDCPGPSRLPHESRSSTVNRRKVGESQRQILRHLAYTQGWPAELHPTHRIRSGPHTGLPEVTHVLYYGGHDTTPRAVRLIADYVRKRRRRQFLKAIVTQPSEPLCNQQFNGRRFSVQAAVVEMTSALMSELTETYKRFGMHLPVSERTNRKGGHRYPHLRDGHEAFAKDDGTLVGERHVSYDCAVLYYDALRAFYELFKDDSELASMAAAAAALAAKVRHDTVERFWVMDVDFGKKFPAMCLEWQDEVGQWVPLGLSSNAADGFGTSFYDVVKGDDWFTRTLQHELVTSLVERYMGPEFLTDVGLRMRGLRLVQTPSGRQAVGPKLPYPDYQSEYVSWPVITILFAQGLRHHGFDALARELEERVVWGFIISGCHPEYWFVNAAGRAFLSRFWRPGTPGHPAGPSKPAFRDSWHDGAVLQIFDATMLAQLWSIAADLCARLNLFRPDRRPIWRWQRDLTGHVLSRLPEVAHNRRFYTLFVDQPGLREAQAKLDPQHRTIPTT